MPPPIQAVTENQVDLSCAYFYFLWGTHAEFNGQYAEALEAYEKALICDENAAYIKEKIPLLLLKMGEFAKAADWLARAIEEHPDSTTYRLLLASLYIQEDKIEEALLLYSQVLEREPDNEGVHLRLALLYSHLGRYRMAEEIFKKLLRNDVDSYFTHLSYARLLKQMEKFHQAAKEYEKALSLNWSKELAFEIGFFYVDQEMYHDALRIYTTITEDDPRDERAALSRIQALLDLDQSDGALDELKSIRLYSENPTHIDLIIAKVLLRQNKESEGRKVLRKIIREGENSEARYLLALLAYQEEDYPTSLAHLTHIKKNSEEFEEAVYLQTRIYQTLGKIDEAIKLLQTHTVEEADRSPLFYALLSSLYQAKGENDKAMTLLEEAIDIYPDNAQLLFEYGLMLEQNGMYERAIDIMEKVLVLQPDHAEALNYIGYTWADKNMHLKKALEYILRANTLKPDNGFIIDSLGWVYFRLGNLQKAVRALERSLELISNDPHIYDHLGDVYRALGRFPEAKDVYQKAYEMFKDEKNKADIQQKIDALEN
jgi:tetratricopeptide (TPR) repeat protein